MATRDGIMKALNALSEESGVVVVYMSAMAIAPIGGMK